MSKNIDTDPCVICGLDGATTMSTRRDGITQKCRRCGDFFVSGTVLSSINRLNRPERIKLGNTVRRTNMASGAVVELNSANLNAYLTALMPDVLERADDIFLFLAEKTDRLTHFIDLSDFRWELYATAYAVDFRDLHILIDDFLIAPGFLKKLPKSEGEPQKYRITREGYQRLREIQKRGADNVQVFVAMWFGGKDNRDTMNDIYMRGLAAGIERAGYKPYRVDKGEYNGKIDDEIIRQIRRSRFLVADFTAHVNGVYYEAGYAEGLGLEIIQTCREDYIGDLHFDKRQVNTVPWQTPEELADKLHKRIEATIGRGPL
ncbi:MAG: hypothetical protein ACK4NA_15775 [Alphaproteobacteria bacterium]